MAAEWLFLKRTMRC